MYVNARYKGKIFKTCSVYTPIKDSYYTMQISACGINNIFGKGNIVRFITIKLINPHNVPVEYEMHYSSIYKFLNDWTDIQTGIKQLKLDKKQIRQIILIKTNKKNESKQKNKKV